jgi:DNA-binding NtrC family response regulator
MKLPVLTMSGYLALAEVPSILSLGASEHLPKPFHPHQLLEAVGRVMGWRLSWTGEGSPAPRL